MWKPYNLDLFLDITTACNAVVAYVVRTNVNTNKKEDWLYNRMDFRRFYRTF